MGKHRGGRPPDDEAMRQQAAATLARLFHSLYEGAFAIDRNARITWMNDKFKALIGWNGVVPVEGQPVEEIIPGSRMREVVETGRAELIDVFDLGKRQVVVSRMPLTDEAGVVTGAIGVILYDRLNALKPLVERIQSMQSRLAAAETALKESRRARWSLASIVGSAPPMLALKRAALVAARRDATVLILGETGTGKELLAHAIHAASPRRDQAMVRVNVAAIPETLIESELFGVVAGAFTGASRQGRDGKLALADGGTLFLDEIGDLPLALQPKLLRALEEGEYEPLGSNRVRRCDVRLISATSRDLAAMVSDGGFRADLYYRLNVLPLRLPPLRERLSDLPQLAERLLADMYERAGAGPSQLDDDAIAALGRHGWPGNIRELRNVLEQACLLAGEDDVVREGHITALLGSGSGVKPPAGAAVLPDEESAPPTSGEVRPLRDVVLAAEREALGAALAAADGVKTRAARLLGISRAQFYEKLAVHGLIGGDGPVDTDNVVRIAGHLGR